MTTLTLTDDEVDVLREALDVYMNYADEFEADLIEDIEGQLEN